MIGHATIPFLVLAIALANLYLGYATAVYLGYGPLAHRGEKAAAVDSEPLAPPAAKTVARPSVDARGDLVSAAQDQATARSVSE